MPWRRAGGRTRRARPSGARASQRDQQRRAGRRDGQQRSAVLVPQKDTPALGSTGRASAGTPWAAIRRRPRARERAAASAVLDVSLIGRSWRQRSVSLVPLVHLVKDG